MLIKLETLLKDTKNVINKVVAPLQGKKLNINDYMIEIRLVSINDKLTYEKE